MRTFLTEFYVDDIAYEGEPIEAISWADAEYQATQYGLSVYGEYQGHYDDESKQYTVNPNLN